MGKTMERDITPRNGGKRPGRGRDLRTRQRTHRKLDTKLVDKLAPIMLPGEIGEIVGVHRTTVMRYLKSHEIPYGLDILEEGLGRTFLLSSLQALDVKNRAIQYFGGMPEESFAALPAHIKTKLIDSTNNSAGTDFDKYRLAQGMSTSIIDERSLSISIQAKKEELDKVLGTLKSLCAAKK